mmetsp:Transcript_22060/g.62019  ORF Transcript_22060/g.62019 Transcript_22060/m.62019 type:complete len:410 (+) Transcript_22060:120-1349(+)
MESGGVVDEILVQIARFVRRSHPDLAVGVGGLRGMSKIRALLIRNDKVREEVWAIAGRRGPMSVWQSLVALGSLGLLCEWEEEWRGLVRLAKEEFGLVLDAETFPWRSMPASREEKELMFLVYKATRNQAVRKKMAVRRGRSDNVDIVTSLSIEEFRREYLEKGHPVVLRGHSREAYAGNVGFDNLVDVVGDIRVETRVYKRESPAWGNLEDGPTLRLSEFLTLFHSSPNPPYLFDVGLPLRSKADFRVPRYFENVLDHLPEGCMYKSQWPSLFVGKKGSMSGLHVDAFGSHFWMCVFEGRKRWRLYAPDDLRDLGAVYHTSLDPTFLTPAEAWPIPLYDFTLEAGDLLFVPSQMPHFVENLSDSIAISGNFVHHDTNLPLSLRHFLVLGVHDDRFAQLHRCLSTSTAH